MAFLFRATRSLRRHASIDNARSSLKVWLESSVKTRVQHGVHEGIAYYDTGEDTTKPPGYTVVLAHGYGLGSGIWSANLDDIMSIPRVTRVVAFDWLGMGASNRPQPGTRRWWNSHAQVQPKNSKIPIRKFYHIDETKSMHVNSAHEFLSNSPLADDTTKEGTESERGTPVVLGHAGAPLSNIVDKLKRKTKLWVNCILNKKNPPANAPSIITANSTSSGCSSSLISRCSKASSASVEEAVDFFLAPLPSLYSKLRLHNPVLVGHSMGGYLSAHFVHRHPELHAALVLASPAGVTGGQANEELRKQLLSDPSTAPKLLRLLDALWRLNVTPQQLLRLAGPQRGRRLAVRLARRVFGDTILKSNTDARESTEANEAFERLVDYLYHISTAPASGEYALSSLLYINASDAEQIKKILVQDEAAIEEELESETESKSPVKWTVHAREPVNEKLMELIDVPVHFIYGEHDWLFLPSVPSLIDLMRERRKQQQSLPPVSLTVLPDAGHHLYSNNPKGFSMAIASTVNSLPPPTPSPTYAPSSSADAKMMTGSLLSLTETPCRVGDTSLDQNVGPRFSSPRKLQNNRFQHILKSNTGLSRNRSVSANQTTHTFSTWISDAHSNPPELSVLSSQQSRAQYTETEHSNLLPLDVEADRDLSFENLPRGNLSKPFCPFAKYFR